MGPPLGLHLAALALCAADVTVRAVRLRMLIPGGSALSVWRAVTINAYGDAASAITPARLGGDPARFAGCRQAGINTPRALAGLGVEALIDWALLLGATVALGFAFADTAAAGARHLITLATSPKARLFVALTLVLVLASAVAARWYRRRIPFGLLGTLGTTWRHARQLGWPSVTIAASLTALSMALRVGILPVLVAGQPGVSMSAVIVGSYTLLFGQLALPTPAGAGAVELGFVGGFAETLSPGALAGLLVAWRVYTLILPAALGAVLLAIAAGKQRADQRRVAAEAAARPSR